MTFLVLVCLTISLFLCGCVNGIPPPDGWDPPKVKQCQVVLIQDGDSTCLSRWEFNEWRRMNGL